MKTRDVVTMAFLTAILLVAQVSLAALPNVELVTLLIILYTLVYKKKVFLIIYTFAILEGLIYGFGIWWFMYLYVWPILAMLVLLFEKHTSYLFCSVLSGIYGLLFGTLCSIPYFITGGWASGFGYWIAGVPYDLIHCVANVGICLILFKPLYSILNRCVTYQKNQSLA